MNIEEEIRSLWGKCFEYYDTSGSYPRILSPKIPKGSFDDFSTSLIKLFKKYALEAVEIDVAKFYKVLSRFEDITKGLQGSAGEFLIIKALKKANPIKIKEVE